MMDLPLTLDPLFERAESLFADKELVTATATGIERTNYGRWAERTRLLGGALDDLGITADGRVATFAWNTDRHLELYFAAPCSGRVLHTLNIRLFAEQQEFACHEQQVIRAQTIASQGVAARRIQQSKLESLKNLPKPSALRTTFGNVDLSPKIISMQRERGQILFVDSRLCAADARMVPDVVAHVVCQPNKSELTDRIRILRNVLFVEFGAILDFRHV